MQSLKPLNPRKVDEEAEAEYLKLIPRNWGGFVTLTNASLGVAPYFQIAIRNRMNRELAVNVVVTGEAGISKSYTTWSICRAFSERFAVSDIVSKYSEYMASVLQPRRKGVPIGFDEPQYAASNRDWYNQLNKALVKTITSQRFRLRPVFIPIINMNLLDKVLRSYLIQYHIHVTDRGKGVVYQLEASQFEEKLYRSRLCRIQYGLFDGECGRKSCLTCRDMETCPTFRAAYERKKATWQSERDESQLEAAKKSDTREELTLGKMVACVFENVDRTRVNGKITSAGICAVLREKLGASIGDRKAYEVRGQLFYEHPELAPKIKDKQAEA